MLRRRVPLVTVLALAGCFGGTEEPEVTEVTITATPNGPSVVAREGGMSFDRLVALVPERPPPNPAQVCDSGIRLTLRFDDDHVIEYGQCMLPAEIEPLRMRLVHESLRQDGLKLRGESAACGRDAIADWFADARFDDVYGLRCYEQALEGLQVWPESSMRADLLNAANAARVGKLAVPRTVPRRPTPRPPESHA
jgi:hypothetical protein